jgi:hypothetical protein
MKLRFNRNSLRFRLNQLEVNRLASGERLVEEVWFPGADDPFRYSLEIQDGETSAHFKPAPAGIGVWLKSVDIIAWASSDELELHRMLPTSREPLTLMIEKDLECVDAPPEERDPHAFRRAESPLCK